MKVLLVDDNTLIRKVVRAALEAEGFGCIEAASGAEAMKVCADEVPDACLLDFNLPDLDGLAVLQALKSQASTSGVRVFLLSGSDDPNLPARARQLGAEGFLTKPLSASHVAVRLKGT